MPQLGTRRDRALAQQKLAALNLHCLDDVQRWLKKNPASAYEILDHATLAFSGELAKIQDIRRRLGTSRPS